MNQDDIFRKIFKKTYRRLDAICEWHEKKREFLKPYFESDEYNEFPEYIQKWLKSPDGFPVYLKCAEAYREKQDKAFEAMYPHPTS